MILIRTAAPSAYPVTLVEVKSHLNISHSDYDAKLDQFIAAAVQNLDGHDGTLDRAICRQSWTMYLPEFSGGQGADHGDAFGWRVGDRREAPSESEYLRRRSLLDACANIRGGE